MRPTVQSVFHGHVRLKSENKQSETALVLLTTAFAVKNMITVSWDEFKRKHITSISLRAVKFNGVFKAKTNFPSLRTYLSADDEFCLDNPAKLVAASQWLPTPSKELKLAELDLLHMERQSRGSVGALNFMEAVLQAYHF